MSQNTIIEVPSDSDLELVPGDIRAAATSGEVLIDEFSENVFPDDVESEPEGSRGPAHCAHRDTTVQWQHPNPSKWAASFVTGLGREQLDNLRQLAAKPFKIGSDCTGADAPWKALSELVKVLSKEAGIAVDVQKKFCSEIDDGVVSFLLLNGKPSNMFGDFTKRKRVARCMLSGMDVPVPDVDLYTAGWVCKDRSVMNTLHPLPLDEVEHEASGASTRTLHASVRYIKRHEPAYVVLENVFRRGSLRLALKLLRKIKRRGRRLYAAIAFIVNAARCSASSRTRIFVCGVHIEKVRVDLPMRNWSANLATAMESMPRASMEMLPSDHPFVLAEKSKRAVRQVPWIRCKKRHRQVRAALAKQFRERPPNLPAMAAEVSRSCPAPEWLSAISARQRDVLGLHAYAARKALGLNVWACNFFWDLTNNVEYHRHKHTGNQGYLPCLLREHLFFSPRHGRPVLGLEKMWAQGFDDVVMGDGPLQIDDKVLGKLAGDTMSVPIMGLLLGTLFASTHLTTDRSGPLPEAQDLEAGVNDHGHRVGRLPSCVKFKMHHTRIVSMFGVPMRKALLPGVGGDGGTSVSASSISDEDFRFPTGTATPPDRHAWMR